MTFNEYSDSVLKFSKYPEDMEGTFGIVLGLVSEAGEVADILNKATRGDKKYEDISLIFTNMKKELGDVLWFVNTLANRYGFTLEEIAEANAEKLTGRDKRGVIQGDGDDR